jgi:hypothetical protein
MTYISTKSHLYELLGQIVVSFRALERGVDGLILAGFTSPLNQGLVLLNTMTFKEKVPAMSQLIRDLHSVQELGILDQTLHALVERCSASEQERNNWIYSYWVPEVKAADGFILRLQNKNDSKELLLTEVSISELENFIVVLHATIAYLHGFHQKLSNNFRRMRTARAVQDFFNRIEIAAQNS